MRACGATRAGAMRVLLVLVALASPVARSAGVAPAAARHGEAKPVLTTRYVLDPPRGAVAGAGPLKLTTGVVLESLSPPASQYELTSGADAALGSSVWRRALQRALGESFNAKIGAVTVNATVVTALGPDGALRMTNALAVHVSLSAPSLADPSLQPTPIFTVPHWPVPGCPLGRGGTGTSTSSRMPARTGPRSFVRPGRGRTHQRTRDRRSGPPEATCRSCRE